MPGNYTLDADVYCLAKMIYNIICAKDSSAGQIGDIPCLPKALNELLKQ